MLHGEDALINRYEMGKQNRLLDSSLGPIKILPDWAAHQMGDSETRIYDDLLLRSRKFFLEIVGDAVSPSEQHRISHALINHSCMTVLQ